MKYIPSKREMLLVAAGVLGGATIFGWAQQGAWFKDGEAAVSSNLSPTLLTKPVDKEDATMPTASVAEPATACHNAVISRNLCTRGVGRSDPMTPISSVMPPARPASRAANPNSKLIHSDTLRYCRAGAIPPPPKEYPTYDKSKAVAEEKPPLNAWPSPGLNDAIRLVGLVDGKAIFTLPRDVARAHNLVPEFTLGKGQQYAGVTLESVGDSSVTLRAGRTICAKQLGTIN